MYMRRNEAESGESVRDQERFDKNRSDDTGGQGGAAVGAIQANPAFAVAPGGQVVVVVHGICPHPEEQRNYQDRNQGVERSCHRAVASSEITPVANAIEILSR